MTDIQRIELREPYMALLRSGDKTSTIRKGRKDIALGPAFFVCGESQMLVDVAEVTYKRFGALGPMEAESEGFSSINELCAVLGHIYPALEDDTEMTVVHFFTEPPF